MMSSLLGLYLYYMCHICNTDRTVTNTCSYQNALKPAILSYKIKIFLGRGTAPSPALSMSNVHSPPPQWGEGHPLPKPLPLGASPSRLRHSTSAPSAPHPSFSFSNVGISAFISKLTYLFHLLSISVFSDPFPW